MATLTNARSPLDHQASQSVPSILYPNPKPYPSSPLLFNQHLSVHIINCLSHHVPSCLDEICRLQNILQLALHTPTESFLTPARHAIFGPAILIHEDKIWRSYFVWTKYDSHILSSWIKSGWSPLANYFLSRPNYWYYCARLRKGTNVCKGGRFLAATFGPGGPLLVGDRILRDTSISAFL